MLTCNRCGTPSGSSACRTCNYLVPATLLALGLLTGCPGEGTVTLGSSDSGCGDDSADTSDTGLEPIDVTSLEGTEVPDWIPLTSGNWDNELTDDECDDPNGPVCYDCVHAPTGTYARWFRVDVQGSSYRNDQWFGATLGQLVFTDGGPEEGAGLATDGAYYDFAPGAACAPVYWLLGG